MKKELSSLRHARSKKDFPGLKLEEDEFVEVAFTRAKICLLLVWIGELVGLVAILIMYIMNGANAFGLDRVGRDFLNLIFTVLLMVMITAGIVTTTVFRGNRLYITNKRAIQFVMNSIVSRSANIIDLMSIEDISFRQDTIIQNILHFGTIRMSTVGDETTYTFKYAVVTPEVLSHITHLIHKEKDDGKKSA